MSFIGNLFKGMSGPIVSESKIAETRRKADAGDKEAQFLVGLLYSGGSMGTAAGVSPDYAESARWYRMAAEQDHHAAQLYLGVYLAQGQGVEQNVVEALKWILLAKRGSAWDRHAANDTQVRLESHMTEQQICEARVMTLYFAAERGE